MGQAYRPRPAARAGLRYRARDVEGRHLTTAGPATADRTPARRHRLGFQLAAPVRRFIATEAGSAGLLLAATIAALVWANVATSSYDDVWTTELSVRLGDHAITEDLRHWVNDGLMVFFFLVVGLEVRRELALGELVDRSRLRVPLIAALTGIAVPALIFLALNPSGEAAQGWGVAISTDTAFVLGALALLGNAVPTQLRVFLLTLAIVDDVAALAIIAIFYSDDIALAPLVVVAASAAALIALGRLHVWRGPAYFAVGTVLWVAMLESGVHPAIAGVVIAACIPVFPPQRDAVERAAGLATAFRQSPVPELARSAKLSVERAVSPNERMQELLHPWSSYVVVPVFALANAGVIVTGDSLRDALTGSVGLGIVAGLVLGKLVGVGLVTLLVARPPIGELPRGVAPPDLIGGAALTGIGFTVSLFIVDLAFDSPTLQADAKIGVLTASLVAAALGWVLFRAAAAIAGRTAAWPGRRPSCRPWTSRGTTSAVPSTRRSRWWSSPTSRVPSAPARPGRSTPCGTSSATTCATCCATCPWPTCTPTPRWPPRPSRPPAPRAASGRCTTASSPTRTGWSPTTWSSTRRPSGSTWTGSSGSFWRACTHAGSWTTWWRPRPAASPARPPSSSAAASTPAPTTPRPSRRGCASRPRGAERPTRSYRRAAGVPIACGGPQGPFT